MVKKPEIEGMNIVFRGDFNPKIFQPAWFAAQGLIRNEEADEATVEIIHPTIVVFTLDWLQIQIEPNRFYAGTNQSPYFEILKDLILGTFRILNHTPIKMIGINYNSHFPMDSEDAWHDVGHRVAPKDMWNKILKKPGLRSLTMQGERPDDHKGRIAVRIEPSNRARHGVFININDHYELKDPESVLGCEAIIDMLESEWKSSVTRSQRIAITILEQV